MQLFRHSTFCNFLSQIICKCKSGFKGAQCQSIDDPCISNPCAIGQGKCVSRYYGYYECLCSLGFTGKSCEVIEKNTFIILPQFISNAAFSILFLQSPIDMCSKYNLCKQGNCINSNTTGFIKCICPPGAIYKHNYDNPL